MTARQRRRPFSRAESLRWRVHSFPSAHGTGLGAEVGAQQNLSTGSSGGCFPSVEIRSSQRVSPVYCLEASIPPPRLVALGVSICVLAIGFNWPTLRPVRDAGWPEILAQPASN